VKHYSQAEWSLFIKGNLDESERESQEQHLNECDQCLQSYMEAMEQTASLPQLENEQLFTDDLMKVIGEIKQEATVPTNARRKTKTNHRQTILHYTAAAAVTLLLMGSGVFQQMYMQSAQISIDTLKHREESLSDKLMKKASVMLNSIHLPEKGGFESERK
jgi:predicted anti-sigma-YlaC factor YlaD